MCILILAVTMSSIFELNDNGKLTYVPIDFLNDFQLFIEVSLVTRNRSVYPFLEEGSVRQQHMPFC